MFTTLISADDLAAHLASPHWVIFDCRHDLAKPEAGLAAYHQGHIPGAHFAHTDRDLSGPKTGTNGRHPLPDPQDFLDFLQGHGVDEDSQLIAYDASQGMFAARLWWLARWIGHERVAVLDGGLAAWTGAGLDLSQADSGGDVQGRRGTITRRPALVRQVDADDVLLHLDDPKRRLIDARAPERYRGDSEPLDPVAGHIPGAVNRFYQNNLSADGRFKAAEDLREEFIALLGDVAPAGVVHQCGSGVTACHNLLAMERAGLAGAALYPGSWSEWCALATRPVVRGGGA